jgi:hypothetical protein
MGKTRPTEASVSEYFAEPAQPNHRQYLALRMFLHEGATAEAAAERYGYAPSTVYTLARDFRARLAECAEGGGDPFFLAQRPGRKAAGRDDETVAAILALRKKQLSVPDIKVILDAKGLQASEGFIHKVCEEDGFARLPKRGRAERRELMEGGGHAGVVAAPVAGGIAFDRPERFSSKGVGVLCFLPVIKEYGIDKAIEASRYPGTEQIGKLSSILAFLALKLSSVQRYGRDDGWCMDRGLGMFAGLNVLPKTTWYSSYSDAVRRSDNVAFLKSINRILAGRGLLSDTANLDFTAIPYWGDGDPLENNWSGKRSKALISIQAALAQDPDSGLICYGDTTVKHDNQDGVALEFLDFHRKGGADPRYLVFDSKFTTLENMRRIDERGVKFVTIQRKSKGLDAKVAAIPADGWRTAKIERANHKSRTVAYSVDSEVNQRYGDILRQVFVRGHGAKPATIMTNDFSLHPAEVIRKYAGRWLIENEISEQIHFFHLNRNCSGIVVKVDFDLTMTILAHNLYRLLAAGLPGFSHNRAQTIFDKFVDNYGDIDVGDGGITVRMNRKRTLSTLLDAMPQTADTTYQWLGNKTLAFAAHTHT